MHFSNTRENKSNNWTDLLNNNMILNKLIKSRGTCNVKTKAYFHFGFDPRNSKGEKK